MWMIISLIFLFLRISPVMKIWCVVKIQYIIYLTHCEDIIALFFI